ncbi:MAG: hypothetical protein H7Y38_19950 [Armatimonadetes bacterium]|nr:hypothetical protein [Armatimonadota bacterium]
MKDTNTPPASVPSGISVRAVLLGLVLTVLNVLWVTQVEVRYYMLDGSSLPLFITPVFLLLVLVALNGLTHAIMPLRRFVLRQEELLTAYLMAVVSNTFAGHDMLQNLFGQITHPYYFAPQNKWQDVFIERLPKFLFVSDPEALKFWYRGNTPPDIAAGYFVHWSVPLTLWGIFFLLLTFLFVCITVIVRKAWTENEKLAFPIIQLPLLMTEKDGAFFKNGLMWAGFAFAFATGLINGIHQLYPSVPENPWIKLYDVGQYFTTPPFNAIRSYGMQTSLYPFAIGLAYLIPLDLAFSCWFSYLLARAYFVFGRATGLDGPSAGVGWPYLKEISAGAWIGVAASIIYANRKYLANAFEGAFGGKTAEDAESAKENTRYRWAFLGLAFGAVFLLAWSYLLGIAPGTAAAFFGIFFVLSIAITRVRAEFGTPHEIVFVKPADILVTLLGTRAIGDSSLIGMQSMYWFNRGYRCHPMPNFLEGFKMGEGRKMPFAPLLGVFALAAVVSLLTTFGANYFTTYGAGATAKAAGYKWWVGNEAFAQLSGWLQAGQRPAEQSFGFFVGGLIFTAALAYLRQAYVWWPLHPTGFALGVSYAMNYFWFCVFVAWLAKLCITRYGGMDAHKRAVPFFLGLVLGDYTIGALWSLLGLYLGTPTYRVFI